MQQAAGKTIEADNLSLKLKQRHHRIFSLSCELEITLRELVDCYDMKQWLDTHTHSEAIHAEWDMKLNNYMTRWEAAWKKAREILGANSQKQ